MKSKTTWIVKIVTALMLLMGATLTGMAAFLPENIATLIGVTGLIITVFSMTGFLVALNAEEQ